MENNPNTEIFIFTQELKEAYRRHAAKINQKKTDGSIKNSHNTQKDKTAKTKPDLLLPQTTSSILNYFSEKTNSIEIKVLKDKNKILFLTQENFIEKCNDIGEVMASMSDFYEAGKNDSNAIISLQKHFKEHNILDTRICYESKSLEATIIHHFGSTIIEPDKKRLVIPIYERVSLDKVINNRQGLAFMQALCNTIDNDEKIKKTLNRLSCNRQILISTACSKRIDEDVHNGVCLTSGSNGLYISCNCYLGPENKGIAYSVNKNSVKNNKELPNILISGIKNKNGGYFSEIQHIAGLNKYSALIKFGKICYVISFTTPDNNTTNWDNEINNLMSKPNSTRDKLTSLVDQFSSIYSHILKYQLESEKFVLKDDFEAFGKPRIKRAGK